MGACQKEKEIEKNPSVRLRTIFGEKITKLNEINSNANKRLAVYRLTNEDLKICV